MLPLKSDPFQVIRNQTKTAFYEHGSHFKKVTGKLPFETLKK